MYELALFAGIGGGILGSQISNHTCIGAIEQNKFCQKLLLQRQRDGLLPKFPIWDDVKTFSIENEEVKEYIQFLQKHKDKIIITGGFPCQDISIAGKGAGLQGRKSKLWNEMFRIICEIRPKIVLVENSPVLTSRGLGDILADLAKIRYNAKWGVLGAEHVGARHKRHRMWIRASRDAISENGDKSEMVQKEKSTWKPGRITFDKSIKIRASSWKNDEPRMVGTSHDFTTWVDRSRAIGNAQVPAVVRLAYEYLD